MLPEEIGGGVYHAIYGTIMQAAIAAVIAVPLGIMAAIYLVEYGRGRLAKVTTFMVDILAGVPSIVAALFIFALWIATLGFPQSAFAVSLALVLLMLPVVVRNTEEMLKLVPDELREASYAWASRSGRQSCGSSCRPRCPESSAASCSRWPASWARPRRCWCSSATPVDQHRLFDGNMASLPLLIYTELSNPEAAGRCACGARP